MTTASQQPRLRLRVTTTAEQVIRGGHPWLFAESIREQNRPGEPGELAVIYDRRDRFLGIGLLDPESPLRVRMLHTGKPVMLDEAWWRRRLEAALERRHGAFDEHTTGFRWINGESDGWPGLVLDRYGTVLVLKLYTAAWLPHLPRIRSLIRTVLGPETLVLRLSRNIQTAAYSGCGLEDGQVLDGSPIEASPTFLESGVRFEADVTRGQKTGFFLDQRENRRRVQSLAAGATVLNAFSFSGGFSLYAARGGAERVTDLEISLHALESGGRNFSLNRTDPQVDRCQRETVQADAFRWLEQNRACLYDLVIVDPPSLAKRESERVGAVAAYGRLAGNAVRALRPGGVLVAASCSAHVSAEEFFGAVRETVRGAGRSFTELGATSHALDHPATFPEAHYLKCLVARC